MNFPENPKKLDKIKKEIDFLSSGIEEKVGKIVELKMEWCWEFMNGCEPNYKQEAFAGLVIETYLRKKWDKEIDEENKDKDEYIIKILGEIAFEKEKKKLEIKNKIKKQKMGSSVY